MTRTGAASRHPFAASAAWALVAGALLLALASGCSPAPDEVATMPASDLVARIAGGDAPLVLDVRSEGEFAAGHIPGALNIPHDELGNRLAELPSGRDTEIVVHCKSGVRAGLAERVLVDAGYSNLHDLDGHWNGWSQGGLPQQ